MKKDFALKSDNLHLNRRAATPAFALRFNCKGFPQLAGAGVRGQPCWGPCRGGSKQAHAPLTHAGQGGEARGLRALGRELLDMLGWPGSLLTEAEAFGSLGRREQFERLAGVVDLLGAASGPEGQARSDVGRGAKGVLKAPAKLASTGTA